MKTLQGVGLEFKARVLTRHPDTAFQTVDGQAMVVIPATGEVQVLSEVGTLIWDLIDGRRTIGEIMERILEEYETDPARLEKDVQEFVATLEGCRMLSTQEEKK